MEEASKKQVKKKKLTEENMKSLEDLTNNRKQAERQEVTAAEGSVSSEPQA